jgi:hypothetical protein
MRASISRPVARSIHGRTTCRPRRSKSATGVVWVGARAGYADGDEHWQNRLRDGLEQNIPLILAKAVLGLDADGVPDVEVVRAAALFCSASARRLGRWTDRAHCAREPAAGA